MGSLPQRPAAREPAVAREAQDLRGQIAALTVRPGDLERDLERLRIAGEMFAEVPAEDGPQPAAHEPVVPRPLACPGRGVLAVEPHHADLCDPEAAITAAIEAMKRMAAALRERAAAADCSPDDAESFVTATGREPQRPALQGFFDARAPAEQQARQQESSCEVHHRCRSRAVLRPGS